MTYPKANLVDFINAQSTLHIHFGFVPLVINIVQLEGSNRERRLRVDTRNFSGLCSERKQREIGKVLVKDVIAGQESLEKENSSVHVEGYKWFRKPRTSQRGEEGVGLIA